MDLRRLAQLFCGPRALGLSLLQPLGPVRGGGQSVWLRTVWLTRLEFATSYSSLSQLPLDQGRQRNTSSACSGLSQPSLTATREEEEEEPFGTLSDNFSSRRMFRKSTAQLYNLRLREQSAEGDEDLEPQPWQGRRNTPRWYFFQCKRLIREGKVRGLRVCRTSPLRPCRLGVWKGQPYRPGLQVSAGAGIGLHSPW